MLEGAGWGGGSQEARGGEASRWQWRGGEGSLLPLGLSRELAVACGGRKATRKLRLLLLQKPAVTP